EFENLSAANALYRPGPMGQIPVYIKNKLNPDSVTYLHPKLEHILNVTYGCMVYQEQVMQIVRDVGGFTMGRSDLLRRAMGKKKMSVMLEERKNFIYGKVAEKGESAILGAVNNGVDEQTANDIYDLMVEFAKYAFPKAHSVAYAALAYETAWLKLYYPVEFMAALISSIMGSSGTVSLYIRECKRLGIEILPPDVNESSGKFTVEKGKIRFGLAAVKNVGTNVIAEIIKAREEKGKFVSFSDFCTKVDQGVLNKRQIESLIKCGAFDFLNARRAQLMEVYEKIIDTVVSQKKKNIEGQFSLFDDAASSTGTNFSHRDELPNVPEFNEKVLLSMEKEMVGVYLSGHPLSEYEKELEKSATTNTSEIAEIGESENNSEITDGSRVIIGGIIIKKQNKITKNNNMMAFVTLEDLYGTVEVIIFPQIYERYREILQEDSIVLVEGNIDASEEDAPKLICNKITELKKEITPTPGKQATRKVYIKVEDSEHYKDIKKELMNTISMYSGNDCVIIYNQQEKANMVLPKKNWVNIDSKELIEKLKALLGEKNIAMKNN
ncbi:MAG TPA: DNA polymerase III subunit alpha, partial [Clostridiales bacterium]|nr:DNA polymerase III subunit alpha [Clostridiales bacterium]